MSNVALQVRDAVLALLNAAPPAGLSLGAVATPKPEYTLEELAILRAVVVIPERSFVRESRSTTTENVNVEVGIIRRVGFDQEGNLDQVGSDQMDDLADAIADLLADGLEGFRTAGPREPQVSMAVDGELARRGIVAFSVNAEYVVQRTRRP